MKSVLLSIKPKWVAKILNGEKTVEVRRKFPKDYKGWVYIYCTKMDKKGLNQLLKDWKLEDNECWFIGKDIKNHNPNDIDFSKTNLNGKVVARFYCDKVEEISYNYRGDYTSVYTDTLDTEDLEKQACLTRYEFADYLDTYYGYAIHISQLEIFDEPKELSEFRTVCPRPHRDCKGCKFLKVVGDEIPCHRPFFLTKAPQSYQWIEEEE